MCLVLWEERVSKEIQALQPTLHDTVDQASGPNSCTSPTATAHSLTTTSAAVPTRVSLGLPDSFQLMCKFSPDGKLPATQPHHLVVNGS